MLFPVFFNKRITEIFFHYPKYQLVQITHIEEDLRDTRMTSMNKTSLCFVQLLRRSVNDNTGKSLGNQKISIEHGVNKH